MAYLREIRIEVSGNVGVCIEDAGKVSFGLLVASEIAFRWRVFGLLFRRDGVTACRRRTGDKVLKKATGVLQR